VTCIVGIQHEGRVLIGGDSCGAGPGWANKVRAEPKVFRNGPYVMGFTTSFRMGQLLRYALKPPTPTRDLDRFMVTTFVDAVRTCLKEGGWARKDYEREEGGQFLVGVTGRLYAIHSDYQVARTARGYDAVGCGQDYALGSLHATGTGEPRRRIRQALQAAADMSGGVCAPFHVLEAKKK
jgi:ATP-dependent protease HslVU (ClpYQ) peptidase subunit